MDGRHLVAYLLILLLVLGFGAIISRMIYFSHDRVYRRQRLADEERWARNARSRQG